LFPHASVLKYVAEGKFIFGFNHLSFMVIPIMQTQTRRLSREDVVELLKDFYGIPDWLIERGTYYSQIEVPSSYDYPAIYFNDSSNTLVIEYPDENEEIANPYSALFYPEINVRDDMSDEDVVKELSEWIDEETAKKIVENCRKETQEKEKTGYIGGFSSCVNELFAEEYSEILEKEAREEVKKIENAKPEHKMFCGVPVVKQLDIYEETRSDGISEYTALVPSITYHIDLAKVPDKKTLECILEKIQEDA